MTQRTPRAGAAKFAHLLGGFRPSAAKSETEDKTDPKAEEVDEDGNPITPAEDEEGVDKEDKPELEDVEDPADTIDEEKAPEEDDADPKMKKAAANGRKAENARWSKVMAHPAAAGRVPSACHLLTTTPMASRDIVATLRGLPAAAAPAATAPAPQGALRRRMAEAPAPRLSPDGGKSPADQSFGEQVASAVAKVRGAAA